jgi:hypothetical protein
MCRPALWRRCVVKVCTYIVLVLMAAVVAGAIWLRIRNQDHPPPRFYATITTADLHIGRQDGMMSTSFDLSLGVAASPGRLLTCGGYCLERGTAVQVSYRGAALGRTVLASSEAVCAAWWLPPENTRWTSVVALGSNITALPGFLADGLAADARSGVREFDVSIKMADGKTAAWCGARRVGDEDKAAAACDVHYSIT